MATTISYTADNGSKRVIERGVRRAKGEGWLAIEVHLRADDGVRVAEKLLGGPFSRRKAAAIAGATREL